MLTRTLPVLLALLVAAQVFAGQPVEARANPHPTPAPEAMGRLVTTGFEGSDKPSAANITSLLDGWFQTQAVALPWTYVSSPTHSGGLAVQNATGAGDLSFALGTVAQGTTIFARGYFYIPQLPSAQSDVITIYGGGNATLQVDVSINTNGTMQVGGTPHITSANAINLNAWNMIEVQWLVTAAGTTDVIGGRLNGVDAGTLTISGGTTVPDTVRFNALGGNAGTIVIDDIAINDSLGGNQNSYPGPGNVVMLKPASDNAVGTGWTLGTGTAISSNGFTAVKNTPPLGVADLTAGSDTKQIRNASSNANVDYKANTNTYLSAGIGLQDTITLVQALAVTAAPVTTSAKTGNLGATNPTIALATIGTFYSGVNAGTYPTGWKVNRSAVQYAPTPTLGSAAVLDVQQVTASTRIAMVAFLGLVVEYVPVLPVELMGRPYGLRGAVQMNQLLAQ